MDNARRFPYEDDCKKDPAAWRGFSFYNGGEAYFRSQDGYMTDFDTPNPFFRVDLLTGCSNLVSFSKALDDNFENKILEPLSPITVDVYPLRDINQTKG